MRDRDLDARVELGQTEVELDGFALRDLNKGFDSRFAERH